MPREFDELVQSHYISQAEKHGASPYSTMEDETVRQKEIELLRHVVCLLAGSSKLKILDLGCGNGFALSELTSSLPQHQYWGMDFSEALLVIAKERNLPRCELSLGDARSLSFDTDMFDVVYTERCLINVLDWDEQKRALREISRVLKPGGHYLMIESFTDGLSNNNKARTQCGLPAIEPAHHNNYFDKDAFLEFIAELFTIVDAVELSPGHSDICIAPNFLSSYYFVSRVFYPLITKVDWVRNSEFAKFFSFLPPNGNYSPLQAYILRNSVPD